MALDEGRVTANGIDFAYLECGSGPLALCLHGFPDCASTWRYLLPELAAAGFRAVAPWLRGYAPTSIPADGRYQTGALVADACALHEALGGDSDAVIVGHDWGAIVATGAAVHQPDRWRRIVTAAVPPAPAMAGAFGSYRQLRRSWYMFLFQQPMADVLVGLNDLAFIGHLWEDWSPGYDATEDLEAVKASLRDPANLAAAIGYYRAQLRPDKWPSELANEQAAATGTPPQPHLYLHGTDDGCVGVELVQRAQDFLPVPGSRVEIVDGPGHFLHLEQPSTVNKFILEFLVPE